MSHLKTFVYAFLAGICIAIGGTVFLSALAMSSAYKPLGAILFTVGLFTICTCGFNLFTGKVCYVFERPRSYLLDLLVIWVGNLIGTYLTALAESLTRIGPSLRGAAQELCAAKLNDTLPSLFFLAVLCNVMIYIAVDGYNKNPHELGKYLALFLGIAVFILCGFEHCVADMYYFSMAGVWGGRAFLELLVMTLGNAVGGVLFPLLRFDIPGRHT